MSRRAFIWTSVLLLVLACALAEAQLLLEPAAPSAARIGALAGRALVIYGLCAILPLILWIFGRFRLDNVLGPVAVWGGLIVVASFGVAVAGNPAVLNFILDRPDVRRGFEQRYIPSARQSCVNALRANPQARLTPAQIEAYCGCFAERSAGSFTGAELIALLANRQHPAPELRAKLTVIATACARQTLQPAR